MASIHGLDKATVDRLRGYALITGQDMRGIISNFVESLVSGVIEPRNPAPGKRYNVYLRRAPDKGYIPLVKVIRDITLRPYVEVKNMVYKAQHGDYVLISKAVSALDADAISKKIYDVGGLVDIRVES